MTGARSPKLTHRNGDQIGRSDHAKKNDETAQPEEADSGWGNRSQLTLLIENIPGHWMAADLKEFLDGFGNIVKVDIFEDREVLPPHPFQILMADWKGQWKGESDLQVIRLLVAILISFIQTGTRKSFLGIRLENGQNLVWLEVSTCSS